MSLQHPWMAPSDWRSHYSDVQQMCWNSIWCSWRETSNSHQTTRPHLPSLSKKVLALVYLAPGQDISHKGTHPVFQRLLRCSYCQTPDSIRYEHSLSQMSLSCKRWPWPHCTSCTKKANEIWLLQCNWWTYLVNGYLQAWFLTGHCQVRSRQCFPIGNTWPRLEECPFCLAAATIDEGIYFWGTKPHMNLIDGPLPTITSTPQYIRLANCRKEIPSVPHTYMDSSWGNCLLTCQSFGGLLICMTDGPIRYKSQLWPTVPHSLNPPLSLSSRLHLTFCP